MPSMPMKDPEHGEKSSDSSPSVGPRPERETAEDFANLRFELNKETGQFRAYTVRTIVATSDLVKDPTVQISLEDAKRVDPAAEVGGVLPAERPAEVLGRIAAELAKQVIFQKVREAERDTVSNKDISEAAWDEIEKAHRDKTTVLARIIDRIKGGLTVDVLGVRAFLPVSQIDLRPGSGLDSMKGQVIEVRIIDLNKSRGNIVTSNKQLLREEPGSGEEVMEFAKVLAHAIETFGSKTNANAWLNRPSRVFGHQSPLQILTQDPSAVEEELVRIDHGMYV